MNPSVLAFDYGQKRTGVAVGDLTVGVSHPLDTIVTTDEDVRLNAIAKLVAEWQPGRLVVGVPHREDGAPHALADTIRDWGARLGDRFGLPVEYVDETLSSFSAGLALAESGIKGRRQKRYLDSVAAQVILQAYLDEHHASA